MSEKDAPKLFLEHLSELRSRLIFYILVLSVGTGLSFYFYSYLLQILVLPLNQKLFYTSPAGGLDLMIKLCLMSGFIISLPVLIFQVVRFIEPTLPKKLNYRLFVIIIGSLLLTLLGLGFAYFVGLPAALYFLSSFSSDQIQALITTQEYFSFTSRYLLGFAVFFQLPLVLFFVNEFYQISASALLRFQKIVIIASLIVAAILTPTPDFVNQIIMAAPLVVLYYFSIGVIYFSNIRKPKLRTV